MSDKVNDSEELVDLAEVIKEAGEVESTGNQPGTTILKKLLAIQKAVNGLKKNKQSHGYAYTTGDKVLAYIKPLMNHYGVLLEPSVTGVKTQRIDYKTGFAPNFKDKSEMMYEVEMSMKWVCADTAEERICPWFGSGANDWEKGYGSALTYAERYFFLKFFHIATDEDDIDNPDRKPTEPVIPSSQQTNAGASATPKPQAPPAEKAPPAKRQVSTKTSTVAKTEEPEAKKVPEEKDSGKQEPAPTGQVSNSPDDVARKKKAKDAFSKQNQAEVLKFLITKHKVMESTVDTFIDKTDIATVLVIYNDYMNTLPAK